MKIASCSIIRLENLYIREFVEHQKIIGFDKVFIYDHNLPDGEHLEDVIDDYIDSGFVEVVDFREGHQVGPAVMEAFQHCYDTQRDSYDWILFCDIDEYLTLVYDENVKDYLNREEIRYANIIKINWMCFDDNDYLTYENIPLNKRFLRTCGEHPLLFKENLHIKSFINCKTDNVNWINGGAHCPCRFIEPNKERGTYDFRKIVINNAGYEMREQDQHRESKLRYINYDLAYLKHFRMKTIEEYVRNKRAKLTDQGYDYIDFDLELFFRYNKKTDKKKQIYDKLINESCSTSCS